MRLSDSYALEESVLADIGVFVEHQNIHGSLPKIWQSWQTEIIKGNYAIQKQKKLQKKLSNKKKLSKIDCRKHNFSSNTKIFARENLILMNESIANNCCKLKHNRLIYGCFSRDGIIRIKREERARPVKIFHMDKLHQLFPHFDFGDVDMTFF